ncbi:MAG: FAD-binding oxidoreductase, partial [Planctomycetia bacterium]|nr:FAD-binding oxidoreductase [Planctomycetia bacterium]
MGKANLEALKQDLREKVRGDVSFDDVTLGIYATDASIYQIKPVGLVLPRDEEDVVAAVRSAAEHGVSILPRGGGTGLGGQAVGPSLVIDFSKYMNRILELDADERWVRVQPGLVLDELNAALARHGLHFAPDPATSNRATIGGMIGNNSAGTKSIIYGLTVDHVLECKVLLCDGTMLELKEAPVEESNRQGNGGGREAEILGGFRQIIERNREEIAKRYPRVMRRVQGYNLDAFTNTDRWNLSKLIVGSEGTLGVVLEAKLNLEPLPKFKALCVVHFVELLEAIRTVELILPHGPSAVEILNSDVVRGARGNLSIAPMCGFLQGDPAAVLIVEFFGESADEAASKANALAADLKKRQMGNAWPVLTGATEQADVW